MQIKMLRLRNLGPFRDLEVGLAPAAELKSNVTVFVGDNGAGKTILLKSLAASLSWFVARLRSGKGSGNPILEDEILSGESSGAVEIKVSDSHGNGPGSGDASFHCWMLAKTRSGKKAEFRSRIEGASALAEIHREALSRSDECSLPLIAFYPAERVVLDVPFRLRGKHTFSQLDGYDQSLNSGVDFRRFFEWFRNREDAENESGISREALAKASELVGEGSDVWRELERLHASSRDRQLTAVRAAINCFMPGFSNLRVRRSPLRMSVDKDGETFNVLQLSQGERSLMALVGDIARRLAMMNPGLQNPLHGDGIVLIDEVDLHLHPTWQRGVIGRLTETFPNCQFALSTHSPLIISDFKEMLIYSLRDGEAAASSSQYGSDANSVLAELMNTPIRDPKIENLLNDLLDLIQDKELPKARGLLADLEKEVPGDNLELVKARMLLRKQELRHAAHN